MTELNYSTRFSKQRTRFSRLTSNQVFQNCQMEKSHWIIIHTVNTEYIISASNQHFICIFHYFDAKLLGKYSQTPVWQLCDSCQILDLINFQNNLTWPNSNTAGISLDSIWLNYSKLTHRYAKDSPFTWFLYWKLPIYTDFIHFICQFYQSVAKMPEGVLMGQLHLSKACWELWLSDDQPHSDYNGQLQRALCIVAVLQSSYPNPQRNKKGCSSGCSFNGSKPGGTGMLWIVVNIGLVGWVCYNGCKLSVIVCCSEYMCRAVCYSIHVQGDCWNDWTWLQHKVQLATNSVQSHD